MSVTIIIDAWSVNETMDRWLALHAWINKEGVVLGFFNSIRILINSLVNDWPI